MSPSPTCRHRKDDGFYCGSLALRNRKYCHYHLLERVRRLNRARALRDNKPFRLEIQSLDNLYAIRTALTDIAQAVVCGHLDSQAAGKALYAIQQVTSVNRRIEQAEAAQCRQQTNTGPAADDLRSQEFPDFEQKMGLPPDADIDAETVVTLQQADEQRETRYADMPPPAPPGVRPGSAADRLYRDESFQMLRLQVQNLRFQLREYHAMKDKQLKEEFEKMRKPAEAANPQPKPLSQTA